MKGAGQGSPEDPRSTARALLNRGNAPLVIFDLGAQSATADHHVPHLPHRVRDSH
jgi:hypothetical protein